MGTWLFRYKIPYLIAAFIIFILIRLSFVHTTNKSLITQNLVSLNYVLCIGVAYFVTFRYVVDYYYRNKRTAFVFFAFIIIVAGSILLFLNYFLLTDGMSQFKIQYWQVFNVISSSFFIILLSGIAAGAFRLIQDQAMTRLALEKTQKEMAKTELDFLKAQINPHFIFNSINTVYVQIDINSVKAKETLLSFSELLRYQLYECNTEKVRLEKEIAYLEHYVDLQRSRKDGRYNISFTYEPNVKKLSIAPLLFMPFVENAFKHLSHHKDKPNYVKMNLSVEGAWLIFSLTNSKEAMVPTNGKEHAGIGLANVKKRLDILYPDHYVLDVDEQNTSYNVKMKIKVL